MKNLTSQLHRGSGVPAQGQDKVLLVGVGQFGAGLQFNQFQKFSVDERPVQVRSVSHLGDEKSLESMDVPLVVVLGLIDHAADVITSIRNIWPNTAIIIAADNLRMAEVYPLLAAGAVDFVSLQASVDELQAKCLLRIGAHQYRAHESSRTFGRLTMNLMQRTVTNGKEIAYLTPIEVKIVRTLVDSLGSVVERNSMKQICWGDSEITDNALNRKIYEVRRTLRRLSENINIRTIYGLGFELRVRG